MVDFEIVLRWMDYIRSNPEQAYRFSENFWPSQIASKRRLLDRLPKASNYTVFGGWYGILAQMIQHKYPFASVTNVDVDPTCKGVFDHINQNTKINHVTSCMSSYDMSSLSNDSVLVNTSTEHVPQDIYDLWWNSIPEGKIYIIQGNNLIIDEHVRPTDDLEEFLTKNHAHNAFHVEEIDCGTFTRFMAIAIK